MLRQYCVLAIALIIGASSLSAQQAIPPAAPTIGTSGGVGAGIAIPVGRLSETHSAGYVLTGLVDFSAADQPYSFRGEFIFQHYDRKESAGPGNSKNIASLGASLLARGASKGSSAFVLGGIGIYRVTDEGTKPGVNVGLGLEVPLTDFIGIADIRLHYILTDKPAVTIPITLGARF